MSKEVVKELFRIIKLNKTKHEEVSKLLEDNNLDINITNSWNETLLYNCCKHAVNIPMLDMLYNKGCDAETKNDKDLNSFDACLKWNHKKNSNKVLDWLYDKKISFKKEYPDLPDVHNIVICYGDNTVIYDWAKIHFNLNQVDNNGNTPLHISCHQNTKHNAARPCRLLCEDKTININAINNDGQTALHLAAKSAFSNCAKILIDNGADTKIIDNYGNIPYQTLVKNKEIMKTYEWIGDYDNCEKVLSLAKCPDEKSSKKTKIIRKFIRHDGEDIEEIEICN